MPANPTSSSAAFVRALVIGALLALSTVHATAETIVGSGVMRTESREVSGFRGIALGVPARLELRQGASDGLSITGDDNVVARVETVVKNGTLEIRWADKRNVSTSNIRLDIVVSARNVEALAIAGSGQVHAARLTTGNLHASLDGSGGVAIDALEARSVVASINGSGDLKAAGRAESLEVAIAGSGQLIAPKLESRNATITLAGSGDATLGTSQTLAATVVGSGNVKYYGAPDVRRTIVGSGRVVRAGEAP